MMESGRYNFKDRVAFMGESPTRIRSNFSDIKTVSYGEDHVDSTAFIQ